MTRSGKRDGRCVYLKIFLTAISFVTSVMAVDIVVAEEVLIDTDAVVARQLTVGTLCKNQPTALESQSRTREDPL